MNQTDNFNRALQNSPLSAVTAYDLALIILAVLRKDRSHECFKEFGGKLLSKILYYHVKERYQLVQMMEQINIVIRM